MNGVAREYWRGIFDLNAPVEPNDKRPRPRPKEVKLRVRQKVAKNH